MSEDFEYFSAIKASRSAKHREWKAENTKTLEESGLKFISANN